MYRLFQVSPQRGGKWAGNRAGKFVRAGPMNGTARSCGALLGIAIKLTGTSAIHHFIGRHLFCRLWSRVNIRPQIVPRHAVKFLGGKHELVRHPLGRLEHFPNRSLRASQCLSKSGLRSRALQAGMKGFEWCKCVHENRNTTRVVFMSTTKRSFAVKTLVVIT